MRDMGKRVRMTPKVRAAFAAVKSAMDTGRLPPEIVTQELGISGTTIWAADVQSESNVALIHQLAYGRAGSRAWGEWEKAFRTDEACAKAVEFTKSQIRDALVDVQMPDEDAQPNRALAQAQTDFARWNLLAALEPGWSEISQQMTEGMLVPGFSLHEIVPAPVKHKLLPGGSGYRVAKLAQRLPSSIQINGWVEENGELAAIRQWGPKDGTWVKVDLPASKVLLASWNRTGNNYLGFSAFRAVWYLVKLREHLLKVLGVGASREAAGVPIATMDREVKLSAGTRKKLQRFLGNMQMHENASAVMPAGVKLEWLYSPAANKGHVLDTWKELGTAILGQLQAQQMALGVGNTGSRAVGQVHDSVADAFATGVIANITRVINGQGFVDPEYPEFNFNRPYEGLVRKLIDWNWGPQPAYPEVIITPRNAKLPADQYATAGKTMKDGGMITVWNVEDENSSREKLGLRSIDEDEFNASKQEKADAAVQQMKLMQQRQPPPGTKPEPDDDKPPPPTGKLKASAAWQPRRPLRASEQSLALADMVGFLDGGKEKFERGVKPIVVEMLTRALPDVRTAMKDGTVHNGELRAVKLDTSRLEKFIGSFLDTCRTEGYRHVGLEYAKAQHRMRGASEEDDDFKPPTATPPEPSTQQQQLLQAQRNQLVRRMASRLDDQLEQTAIDVLRTGGEPEEVVSDVVADQVESGSFKGDAGAVMTRAFNMGRQEFADKYANDIESAELSSILDDGTCDYCESMDGTELDFGSANEESLTPPLRQCDGRGRCRCLKVFNFKPRGGGPGAGVDDDE